jgi:hypothetical protein
MKTGIYLLFITVITLIGCSPSIHIYSDYDKDANISNFKTFSWLTEEEIEAKNNNPLYFNELSDKRIKHAVYEQMSKRGFVYKNDKQPLEMHYHIIVEDKTLLSTEPAGYIYGPFFQQRRTQWFPYKQGTLIIDLMDTRNKTLVWRGWATGTIEDEVSKKPEQAIMKAVSKIFKQFPYQR